MEFKAIAVQDSLQIEDERTVKGIFAVTGNVDQVGDIIHKGAFTKTAQEGLASGHIRVLWQHDSMEPPIGQLQSLSEVGKTDLPERVRSAYPDATGGLLGVWRALDTPRGNEVLAGIKAGAITQNSIGFDVVKWDTETVDNSDEKSYPVRNLREVRLWDVSPVNWGANPATANVKQYDDYQVRQLVAFIDECKAGRVLSAANLEKLKGALATLTEILTAAEPPADDESAKALTAWMLEQRLAIAERELALIA